MAFIIDRSVKTQCDLRKKEKKISNLRRGIVTKYKVVQSPLFMFPGEEKGIISSPEHKFELHYHILILPAYNSISTIVNPFLLGFLLLFYITFDVKLLVESR